MISVYVCFSILTVSRNTSPDMNHIIKSCVRVQVCFSFFFFFFLFRKMFSPKWICASVGPARSRLCQGCKTFGFSALLVLQSNRWLTVDDKDMSFIRYTRVLQLKLKTMWKEKEQAVPTIAVSQVIVVITRYNMQQFSYWHECRMNDALPSGEKSRLAPGITRI